MERLAGLLLACRNCQSSIIQLTELMSRRNHQSHFDVPPIPKIIHQVWIPNWSQVPANIRHTRAAWVGLNPTWKYKFWDENDIESLLKSSFPYLKQTWEQLKGDRLVKRADLARIMILQKEGGLYADMDLLPVLPLRVNSLLTERYLGCYEYDNFGEERICNGFIGAPAKSGALARCLEQCVSRIYHPVLEFLGPRVITSFLLPEKIRILPWQMVLSTKHEEGALCINLNSRSWGESEAGQDWYLS